MNQESDFVTQQGPAPAHLCPARTLYDSCQSESEAFKTFRRASSHLITSDSRHSLLVLLVFKKG
jgi:hypothetical protein